MLRLRAGVSIAGHTVSVVGHGNGPVDAFVCGIASFSSERIEVLDYHEHAIGSGAQARAAAYLEMRIGNRAPMFGVGIDANIVSASMKAVLSGLQRSGALSTQHRSKQWATS